MLKYLLQQQYQRKNIFRRSNMPSVLPSHSRIWIWSFLKDRIRTYLVEHGPDPVCTKSQRNVEDVCSGSGHGSTRWSRWRSEPASCRERSAISLFREECKNTLILIDDI
jgi:hypothetical protein